LEYDAGLFDPATVRRLAGHYRVLLSEAAARPEAPLSSLGALAAAERHQLLAEWNDAAAAEPAGAVHRQIEARAAAGPDAGAVPAGRAALSSGELNRRANRLARRLRRLGVAAERTVVLHLDRSPRSVLALLAVLKAGGAAVPVDPRHAGARLGAIA